MSWTQWPSTPTSVNSLCTTEFKTHETEFSWTIKNFDFHEAKGEMLVSSPFSAISNDKYIWRLVLYPNNDEKNSIKFNKEKFALYLWLIRDNENLPQLFVKFGFDLIIQGKTVKSKQSRVWNFGPQHHGYMRGYRSNSKKQILADNELTICCRVKFSEADNVYSNSSFWYESETPERNLSNSLASFYNSQELSDIKIFVKNKEYPVHKSILAARSPVFAAMFKYDTKENQLNRIDIEDIDKDVMDEMLRYIYTAKCKNLDSLAERLLAAADKYALDHLKFICSKKLRERLSVENAANVLLWAEMCYAKELKAEAIKFIANAHVEVFDTDGWKNILSIPQLADEVHQAVALRYK